MDAVPLQKKDFVFARLNCIIFNGAVQSFLVRTHTAVSVGGQNTVPAGTDEPGKEYTAFRPMRAVRTVGPSEKKWFTDWVKPPIILVY
ncbi:hypothetical protein GCM10020370_11700 [Paenibacillus hodogayensis]